MHVDRDAQRSHALGLGDGGAHVVFAARVGTHVADTEFLLQGLALLVRDVGDDDLGSGGVQAPDGGLAHAPGAAGDDR